MGDGEGGWLLEIEFPRPYTGVVAGYKDGKLMVAIPFHNAESAEFARDEMVVRIQPNHQVITGEVLRGELEQ